MAATESEYDEYYDDGVDECHVEPLPGPEEPEKDDDAADEPTVDIADYTGRFANMVRSVNMARTVTGISPSRSGKV